MKTREKSMDHRKFLGGAAGFGGPQHAPHQADHGVQVVDQCLVPAEDLGTRVLVVGEPVPVFPHQLQVPAGVEDLLEVPGVGAPSKLAPSGCKASTAAPLYRVGCGEGWHSRHIVAGPVALLVQQLCLIGHHHQAPALGGRALVRAEGKKPLGIVGDMLGWGEHMLGVTHHLSTSIPRAFSHRHTPSPCDRPLGWGRHHPQVCLKPTGMGEETAGAQGGMEPLTGSAPALSARLALGSLCQG